MKRILRIFWLYKILLPLTGTYLQSRDSAGRHDLDIPEAYIQAILNPNYARYQAPRPRPRP